MRKLIGLGVLALVMASVALAQVPSVISKTFRQTYLSDGGITDVFAVPTLATDGIDMAGATGWQVILSADAGAATSGGGSVLCYYYATTYASGQPYTTPVQRWTRCKSTTFDVTPVASQRDTISAQFTSSVGVGRLYYLPVAVGTTGYPLDGGVDVTIQVQRKLQ